MQLPDKFTELLFDWVDGDQAALNELLPFVESELLCRAYIRPARRDHTLQTTALVNEAYIPPVNRKQVHWQNRLENLSSLVERK